MLFCCLVFYILFGPFVSAATKIPKVCLKAFKKDNLDDAWTKS